MIETRRSRASHWRARLSERGKVKVAAVIVAIIAFLVLALAFISLVWLLLPL